MTYLHKLASDIHMMNIHKGFWDEYYNARYQPENIRKLIERTFISEKIALIHSETSELLEALRKPSKPDEHCPSFLNKEIEVADILIRTLDLSNIITLNIDLVVAAKLAFNDTRPYKHGKEM